MEKGRTYTLKIWRQPNAETKGAFKIYKVENIYRHGCKSQRYQDCIQDTD